MMGRRIHLAADAQHRSDIFVCDGIIGFHLYRPVKMRQGLRKTPCFLISLREVVVPLRHMRHQMHGVAIVLNSRVPITSSRIDQLQIGIDPRLVRFVLQSPLVTIDRRIGIARQFMRKGQRALR